MSPVKMAKTAVSEQQLGVERAILVYRNSRAKLLNVSYYIKLLGRCEEDSYANLTVPIQKEIIDDLMTNYPHEESVWDYLAQRELNGFSMIELAQLAPAEKRKIALFEQFLPTSDSAANSSISSNNTTDDEDVPRAPPSTPCSEILSNLSNDKLSPERCAMPSPSPSNTSMPFVGKQEFTDDDDDDDMKEDKYTPTGYDKPVFWQKRPLKKRIELCLHVYQVSLRAVKTPKMCTYYINAMLQLNRDLTNHANYKRKCLAIAFREGHESKLMHEEHYHTCLKLLLKGPLGIENARKLLTEAVHLQDTLLYYDMWMTVHMANDKVDELMEVFQKANEIFGADKCVTLWRKLLNFLRTMTTEQEELGVVRFMDFFRECAMQFSHEFDEFRTEYLLYIATTHSIDAARKEYDELCLMPPASLALHRKMTEIELCSKIDVS